MYANAHSGRYANAQTPLRSAMHVMGYVRIPLMMNGGAGGS